MISFWQSSTNYIYIHISFLLFTGFLYRFLGFLKQLMAFGHEREQCRLRHHFLLPTSKKGEGLIVSVLVTCFNKSAYKLLNCIVIPSQTVFVGGILFSHCPWVCLSMTFWFFNILKRQWQNFIKFGKNIDIHKMNIYNRKIRARGQFF